jgi:hypothetical protein
MSGPTFTAGQVLTAAQMELMPKGYIGSANATTTSGIGSSTTDITGASVTFTALASRRYLITVTGCFQQATSAGLTTLRLRNSAGTTLRFAQFTAPSSTSLYVASFSYNEVPGAGSVTYKMSAETSAGTVSVSGSGAASSIVVEDIGT